MGYNETDYANRLAAFHIIITKNFFSPIILNLFALLRVHNSMEVFFSYSNTH